LCQDARVIEQKMNPDIARAPFEVALLLHDLGLRGGPDMVTRGAGADCENNGLRPPQRTAWAREAQAAISQSVSKLDKIDRLRAIEPCRMPRWQVYQPSVLELCIDPNRSVSAFRTEGATRLYRRL
jgi:hypothetical protein